MAWDKIILALNGAPFYMTIIAVGFAIFLRGTSRKYSKAEVKERAKLNTFGLFFLAFGAALGTAMMVISIVKDLVKHG